MRFLLDAAYIVVALLGLPWWLPRMVRTGKIRTDWRARLGFGSELPLKQTDRKRVLIHAVSVGEVNAIRPLVDELYRGTDLREVGGRGGGAEVVIATTTDTGTARAQSLWGKDHAVVRYPLDLSSSVARFLRRINPDVVVLVELEVWPNFTRACARCGIPVCVVNGRLTERSFLRYRKLGGLIHRSFARLAFAAVQDEQYGQRFRALGVGADRIHITGTMKWDSAHIADEAPGADELALQMGIDRNRPLIVAGSTAPFEHETIVASTPPGVQLLCAPRRPEWFDHAAKAMPGCVRRSMATDGRAKPRASHRFLLDTIGELRQAYALADVVIVGRSFGDLHGSDMMEPVALGKATVVGPAVADFQNTVDALLAGGGIVQTSAAELPNVIRELLHDPDRRKMLAQRGRAVIRAHQGATKTNAALIRSLLQTETATTAAKNPPAPAFAGAEVEEKEERL